MKTDKKFLFATVILLAAYVLSACGSAPDAAPTEQAAVKVESALVAYTGTIESMNGNQWLVNGQTLTVAPTVIRDGPFQVGDTVKVEGNVNPDGSFTVSRVEAPSATDLTELPRLGDDNVNANSNDDNSNDDNTNANSNANSNDDNSNDDNTNDNSNDDNANANTNSNDDNTNANNNDDNKNSNSNDNSNDDDDDDISNGSGKDDDDDDDGNSNDDDD